VIPHLPIALDGGISSFRQQGALVMEKMQYGRLSEESVEQERRSFLRSLNKSMRRANCGGMSSLVLRECHSHK
jgi:hypothetical protein